jgi:hypothetical protein
LQGQLGQQAFLAIQLLVLQVQQAILVLLLQLLVQQVLLAPHLRLLAQQDHKEYKAYRAYREMLVLRAHQLLALLVQLVQLAQIQPLLVPRAHRVMLGQLVRQALLELQLLDQREQQAQLVQIQL